MALQQDCGGKSSHALITVLVVDDEPVLRSEMAEELREAGFAVVESTDGDQAKALLERGPRIDLLCTDLRMPGLLDGIGLTRWVKRHRPQIPVIVFSGQKAEPGVSVPADATFTKPLNYSRFKRRLNGLLAQSRLQVVVGA